MFAALAEPLTQTMSAVLKQLSSLEKAMYFFSTDGEKVYHVNSLPKAYVSKEFDAKTWLQTVSSVVGGKVGNATFHLCPARSCLQIRAYRAAGRPDQLLVLALSPRRCLKPSRLPETHL